MPTVAAHPMQIVQDVINSISNCDPTTGVNCSCTDPSYNYTIQCSMGSLSSSSTAVRTKCTYGQPASRGGIANSTGGSLAQKAKSRFSVKPSNSDRQFFTSANQPTVPSVSGANSTYPTSLLFCADPTGNGGTTSSTPDLSYSTTNNQFTNWITQQTKNTTTFNLGFD